MRKLKLREEPKLVGIKKKLDRREAVRERKALSAAHLERAIEKELLERLKSKAYGDAPLNVNESVWQAILDKERARDRAVDLEDEETDEEDDVEVEWENGSDDREFVSDISGDEDDLDDLEEVTDGGGDSDDAELDGTRRESGGGDDGKISGPVPPKSSLGKRKASFAQRKPKRGARVEVEYENETETLSSRKYATPAW